MRTLSSHAIRTQFIEYFAAHHHTIVPSASLIPDNDPSLLFVNAGMVPFKDVFLGNQSRPYTQAASAQRCLRVGGKHNDLDQVGFTPRHHTLFEMLGIFSFGGYFKQEAITMAWRFLTDTLHIPQERLWVSVYHEDDETYNIWRDIINIPEERMSRCGASDNFWSMGDIGPCGPCTEIFYDLGAHLPGGPPGSEEQDGPRYMEIWNIVFMQYERTSDGQTLPLAQPCVDTGMGLERIAAVLQGVDDTFDTDQFVEMISIIRRNSSRKLERHVEKILADHMRASILLIHDGIHPASEGRSYVLRRLIRRALRYAYQAGYAIPCLSLWSDALVDLLSHTYPSLQKDKQHICDVLLQEEVQFARTLKSGMQLLHDAIDALPPEHMLAGDIVFKLYDTYGFPLDVTESILQEKGLAYDQAGFDAYRIEQKKLSQAHTKFHALSSTHTLDHPETVFTGYEQHVGSSTILGLYIKNDNGLQPVALLSAGDEGCIVLDTTTFYAESGGQIGDCGTIHNDDHIAYITDTQKNNGIVLHHVTMHTGNLHVGDRVITSVDPKRSAISQHHSATHLLHAALRALLGEDVAQKGSLVEAHRLRFDFSCTKNLTPKDLDNVAAWVNARIHQAIPLQLHHVSREEASTMGAIGLFDHSYGNSVRVIDFSESSMELCGGTHVHNTQDIKGFYITSYSSISSHVRRIEAIVGDSILERLRKLDAWKNALVAQSSVDEERLGAYIRETQKKLQDLQKTNEDLKYQHYVSVIDDYIKRHVPILIIQCDIGHNMMLRLTDYAQKVTNIWCVCLGIPENSTTAILCAKRDADKHATENFAAQLETIAPLKAGIKPGMIRGVLQKSVDLQTVQLLFNGAFYA